MNKLIKTNAINPENINVITNAIMKIPNDKLVIICTSLAIIGIAKTAFNSCDINIQYKNIKLKFHQEIT